MSKHITFFLTLLVTILVVSSGRRRTLNEKSKNMYRSFWNLKAKIRTCTGKFMCDFQTTSRSCDMNCIDHDKLCDGHEDCSNKADEIGCPPEPIQPSPCEPLQFTCSDGTCISIDNFCDTVNDCGDMSDEPSDKCAVPTTSSPCPECEETCSARHYTCDNGNCVPIGDVCDGEDNCGDQSDEHDNCGCIISTVVPDTCIKRPVLDDIYASYQFAQGGINDCRTVCQALPPCQGVAANGFECIILSNATNLVDVMCGGIEHMYHPCIRSADTSL